jgi:hypothetical protein
MDEFCRKGMRNRVYLILCIFTLGNLSGAAGKLQACPNVLALILILSLAINYYSPTLFGSLGITDVALYTGIYGLVKGDDCFIYSKA